MSDSDSNIKTDNELDRYTNKVCKNLMLANSAGYPCDPEAYDAWLNSDNELDRYTNKVWKNFLKLNLDDLSIKITTYTNYVDDLNNQISEFQAYLKDSEITLDSLSKYDDLEGVLARETIQHRVNDIRKQIEDKNSAILTYTKMIRRDSVLIDKIKAVLEG